MVVNNVIILLKWFSKYILIKNNYYLIYIDLCIKVIW